MLVHFLYAFSLVIVTVFIHAVGFAALIRVIVRSHALAATEFWPVTWLVISLTCWLILVHMTEISVWALFYSWQGCLPDAESSFYFSGVTYTTVGYGDLVLSKPWRILASREGLTGILMCGLSTGLFFAIVNRWVANWVKLRSPAELEPPSETSSANPSKK